MQRDIKKDLLAWKNRKDRQPLLLRGARQVGKSYIIEDFGKSEFQNTVVVNFEYRPEFRHCFTTRDPAGIINKLRLLTGETIEAGQTLLFLDEIQECPDAIMALRYFKEKLPALAVIGAGSLMEFALQAQDFKMPVGRVQFMFLGPLSFGEFLTVSGNQGLRDHLQGVTLDKVIDDVVHQRLLDLLREYLIVGGMPAVVKQFLESRNMADCQRAQQALMLSWRNDLGKYARTSGLKYLQTALAEAPRLVGARIKYSNIDPLARSRDIKQALNLLKLAGIVCPVYATAAAGSPLGAQVDEMKFKLNFLDVGLMQNACGLQSEIALKKDFLQINAGAVAEQFIGQELRAYADVHADPGLFFWARDKKNSSAEVDYIVAAGTMLLPVEVKAGKTGALKSLRIFMEEKKSLLGVRFWQDKLSLHDKILSLPLYMVASLPRMVRGIKNMENSV